MVDYLLRFEYDSEKIKEIDGDNRFDDILDIMERFISFFEEKGFKALDTCLFSCGSNSITPILAMQEIKNIIGYEYIKTQNYIGLPMLLIWKDC